MVGVYMQTTTVNPKISMITHQIYSHNFKWMQGVYLHAVIVNCQIIVIKLFGP